MPSHVGHAAPGDPGRSGRLGTWLILVLVTALALGGAWLVTRPKAEAGASSPVTVANAAAAPKVGQPVPDFTVKTLAGDTVSLSGLRGKPVWITFGATWCAPCRAEAPDLQSAYAAHRADVEVVAFYLSERPADIQRYADLLGLAYRHVPDPDSVVAAAYGVNGIPVHFFVDANGVLVERREGALSRPMMDEALAKIRG